MSPEAFWPKIVCDAFKENVPSSLAAIPTKIPVRSRSHQAGRAFNQLFAANPIAMPLTLKSSGWPPIFAFRADLTQDYMTKPIDRRVVVHFPGFERMTTQAHYRRFQRSAQFSARIWDYAVAVAPFSGEGTGANAAVSSEMGGVRTSTSVYLCDHNVLVEKLSGKSTLRRLLSGFYSAALVVLYGGAIGYFRHAWRFGLFFLFPYLLMGVVLAASLAVATLPLWLDLHPWHSLWSVPLAWISFLKVFLPLSERFLTLHLFADWELAVSAARLDDPDLIAWLDQCAARLVKALDEPADEYVISSHSMGSTLATHVLGLVLEQDPGALSGKKVVFLTLGGAILQCALLAPAKKLRERVGLVARSPEVSFVEVQCLTDIIHFYKCPVVSLCGHPDAPEADRTYIRVRKLLDAERYHRIKRDFLRVHRQYVLHGDKRGSFDFSLLAVGPFPAHLTDDFSKRDIAFFAAAN